MKVTPFDKNTLFQGQPKAIKYAVTYMENYRENEVLENGEINPKPQMCAGTNVNYHSDIESAKADMYNLTHYTNRNYYNVQLWTR